MRNKKLIIFGATGKTGMELVKQSLEYGHEVTAFVRDPEKLDILHGNLTVFTGDVFIYETVEKAIKGHDVVISALGAPALSKSKVRSEGTKNILKAMKAHNMKDFIGMTTLGIGDSKEALSFVLKYLIVPLYLKNVFIDSQAQEALIFDSDLDWTIVRPANLTDGAHSGIYKHGFAPTEKIKLKISRADVADFMLKQVDNDQNLHKTVSLSY